MSAANTNTEDRRSLIWLPWFPRDFLAATRGWSIVARGVYRELLDAQWEMGGLPKPPHTLRALIFATPAEWRAAWPTVEPKFPVNADGRRRNARLEAHRVKFLALREARRAGAELTNARRWGSLSERPAVRSASAERVAHVSPPTPTPTLKRLTKAETVSKREPFSGSSPSLPCGGGAAANGGRVLP